MMRECPQLTRKIIISFHEKFKLYDLGEGHPFRGDRFVNAIKFFKDQGLFNRSEVELVRPEPAKKEDLLRVHEATYVDLIFKLADKSRPYDIETPVSPQILDGALLISGSAIECGRAISESKAQKAVSIGGGHHHAGRNYSGGFCLFNDVAILVEYLRAKYNITRFLILDHDLHFGNGTSDIYYRDPTVLYISLHQDPRTIYPGTGFTWQIGEGKGEGFNVNVPLPAGTSDNTYRYALNEIFVPLAEEFKPQIIITNGGSDPHFSDALGSLSLTVEGFFELSRTIKETADKVCDGKVVTMPGSGYNQEILPRCWYALIAGLMDLQEIAVTDSCSPPEEPPFCRRTVEKTVNELKMLLRKRWACF
jgi:acetoin utilization protein AcuC